MSDITSYRLAAVHGSGFEDEDEMADALIHLVNQLGKDLVETKSLSAEQTRGVESALLQTPQIFSNIRRMISDARSTEEDKKNTLFTLIKMMDDLLSLGALTSFDPAQQKLAFSVFEGGRNGGVKSGQARRLKAEEGWQAIARPMIEKIEAQNPQWSQDDVATEVRALWKEEDGPPGHTTVKTFVAAIRRQRSVNEPPSPS